MAIPFHRSSLGKKAIVAVTGLILLAFVVGHLIGNLQVFIGPQKLNDYAAFLKNAKGLLWGTRVVLIVSVIAHIVATVKLNRLNRASRPVAYERHEFTKASFASRFMIWSGAFLAAYIVYHILHFTVGSAHPVFDGHDVYANIVRGFEVWWVSLVYILAMGALGLHLFHGVFSVFQTLGLTHPKYNPLRRGLAYAAGVGIPLGYISIPVGVLAGIIHL